MKIYMKRDLHERWSSVYRQNPLQDVFNVILTRRMLAEAAPPRGGVVLDAGCGTGQHTILLAQSGLRCVGVDLSPLAIAVARGNAQNAEVTPKIDWVVADLGRLPWDDAYFDLVYCRGVLMHVPGFEATLAELGRVLKPGGAIVIMESNQVSLERWLVALLRVVKPGRARIVRTPAGLERWSERAGDPFLVRMADVPYLMQCLRSHGIDVARRMGTELLDINRWPAGPLRNAVIRLNRLAYQLGLPAALCVSNAIVARKLTRSIEMGGSGRPPSPPQRSSRPGKPGALLDPLADRDAATARQSRSATADPRGRRPR
jgi:ubiquinone/menaquinone biosynthesis C-methylase UbiE